MENKLNVLNSETKDLERYLKLLEEHPWSEVWWTNVDALPRIFVTHAHEFVYHFVQTAAPWQLLRTKNYYWVIKDRVLYGYPIPDKKESPETLNK